MTLVGTIEPSWKDMSNYVVHFAKEATGKSAYGNAISILHERRIMVANAFGAGRHLAPARKSVCFSEVPLHHLKRLAGVRGRHGIGFRKEYIVERGGGPILYAYKDTKQAKAIKALVYAGEHDASSLVWEVAPSWIYPAPTVSQNTSMSGSGSGGTSAIWTFRKKTRRF